MQRGATRILAVENARVAQTLFQMLVIVILHLVLEEEAVQALLVHPALQVALLVPLVLLVVVEPALVVQAIPGQQDQLELAVLVQLAQEVQHQ
jgi:hypothetical protein